MKRVTVTLPNEVVEEIDRWEKYRSKCVIEAAVRELALRRREELEKSLANPHIESDWVAEQGMEDWGSRAEADDEELLESGAGRPVRWQDGKGWTEVSE